MLPSRIDKIALWKAHAERFKCDHSKSELRERTIKGGSKQYVKQCLNCGDPVSSPIKREAALAQNGGVPPPFDEQLQVSRDTAAKASAEKITNADDSAFWQAYEKYLVSPKWQERRKKVLSRAAGLCEGCRENAATQVHHLSYEHVGDEFLFELVAVCDACHEKLHA